MTASQTNTASSHFDQPDQSSLSEEKIRFADSYQTSVNAGTYTITATLTPPEELSAVVLAKPDDKNIKKSVKVHISGPRYSLSPDDIHSVFPPENGLGDYNNVLPHVVLNRPTLPWERLIASKTEDKSKNDILEKIPFLALLLFTEAEELDGAVTPPQVMSLAELSYVLEPGEKSADQVTIIQVNAELLKHLLPTGSELRLLAHGREVFQSPSSQNSKEPSSGLTTDSSQTAEGSRPRAVVIASRLPASGQQHIAHLVMLENRYTWHQGLDEGSGDWLFNSASQPNDQPVRLVCLKSWQFTCEGNKPTLKGRLLDESFSLDWLCVPKTGADAFEKLRRMGYTALPYHLRSGDYAYTLYHGPLVPPAAAQIAMENAPESLKADQPAPVSAESLVRIFKIQAPELKNQHIFDISLAAAWQLGQLLLLRDQTVAMAYFTWRRHDAQLRARENSWRHDAHLHLGDNAQIGLEPMPTVVKDWFQQYLALYNIPFNNLVPDDRMVPENSLRVFSLHTPWMESLLAGALSLGRASDSERQLETTYRQNIFTADQQLQSGFLLRSPVVDEHLDLQVEAISKPLQSSTERKMGDVSQIRLERLGPGLLLGLYASSFAELKFSLPPIGLLFGFEENEKNDSFSFSKILRDQTPSVKLEISFKEQISTLTRGGAVIDIESLGRSIADQIGISSPMPPGLFSYHLCEGTESVKFDLGQSES